MLGVAAFMAVLAAFPDPLRKNTMPSAFQAQSMTVGELLAEFNSFRIPQYQRAFAWTTDEAGHLLEDLIDAASDNVDDRDYFLGALLFMARDDDSDAGTASVIKSYDIVDGQQRLCNFDHPRLRLAGSGDRSWAGLECIAGLDGWIIGAGEQSSPRAAGTGWRFSAPICARKRCFGRHAR